MNVEKKLIRFDKWCSKCKHYNESEFDPESDCYECLDIPENYQTDKPVRYEKNDK